MHGSMSKHIREEKKGGKILGACEPNLMELYEDSYKEGRQGKREKMYRYRSKNIHYKVFFIIIIALIIFICINSMI